MSDVLAHDLAEVLGGIRRRLRRSTRKAVAGEPLTSAQVELLRLVEASPDLGVSDAASALHVAPNTVSTLVRSLVDRGFLVREPDPVDRRTARLRLTPAVRKRMGSWRDERNRSLADALERLPAGDADAIQSALPALRRLLEEL